MVLDLAADPCHNVAILILNTSASVSALKARKHTAAISVRLGHTTQLLARDTDAADSGTGDVSLTGRPAVSCMANALLENVRLPLHSMITRSS